MKVYFLHGKNKTPKDKKLLFLGDIAQRKGYSTCMIDHTHTKDPNIRAKNLLGTLENEKNTILVGASMGGYASVFASSFLHVKAMFLLAPALYLKGYESFNLPLKCQNIFIVHGNDDEVVPLENSIRFAKQTDAFLHVISDNHSLSNDLTSVKTLFEIFLQTLENEHKIVQ